jgi:hypothetical protein
MRIGRGNIQELRCPGALQGMNVLSELRNPTTAVQNN